MALFELASVDAHTFATDPYIALPFFQRKATWNPHQRLGLALSVVRGFPIGTVVVKQTDQQTFLLDGRQRRETLQDLTNPQRVYDWAKVELKVESRGRRRRLNTAEWQVRQRVLEVFREYADIFFFGELRDDEDEPAQEAPPEGPAEPADVEPEDLPSDLRSLFDYIWIGRPVAGTGGARPHIMSLFDFGDAVDNGPYPTNGDLPSLLSWLRGQRDAYRRLYATFPPASNEVGQWLTDSLTAQGATVHRAIFDMLVQPGPIVDALTTMDRLDRALHQTSLGYVKIKPDADEADDMKVFSLINTGGTQLTGPEVLCATPAWNEEIVDPPDQLRTDVEALYAAKGVTPPVDGRINKWDKPATFIDRLNLPLIIGSPESWAWTGSQFDSKINLGFRMLTGLVDGKMMKNDLAKLASSHNVDWAGFSQEQLLQRSYNAAVDQPFFRYLGDWRITLRWQMSEYPAVAFLLTTARDYQAKAGAGTAPAGANLKVFRKNALIRFDRLVYEYVKGSWGHAADSRTAQELRRLAARIDEDAGFVEPPMPLEAWSELVREITQDGKIDGLSYLADKPDPRVVLLLHYANAISGVRPDPLHEPYQVDHIVPQALFRENDDATLGSFEHHIINLAPLNATVNNYKSDRRLNQIDDQHRQEEISRLTRIPVARFNDFSSVTGMPNLKELRGGLLRLTLVEDRFRMLADPRQFFDPQQS